MSNIDAKTTIAPTPREFLAATAATTALSLLPGHVPAAAPEDAIGPCKAAIPQKELDELPVARSNRMA